MAQALLSGIYANTGHSAEAPVYSRKAFELRDRVSERERFFISWRYYVDAEQAWDKALDLGLSWTATYPREAFAFNSLGLASAAFGHHDQAVPAFREAIRLDPGFVPPHGNLAGSLIALNRFDEASAHLQEAAARGVDFSTIRRMAYLLAFVGEDAAAMTRELDMVRRTTQSMWASNWEARTSVFSGRFAAAHELFRRAIEAAIRGGSRELAAQWTLEDAEAHAIAGQCTPARAETASGLALSRDNFTLERAGRTLALCDAGAEASLVSAELSSRFPTATLTTGLHLPVIAAATAVRSGEFARAIALLDPVKTYDHAPAAEFWPAYLRGEAHLGLNDAAAAATQFQSILDRRGKAPASPLYPLAQLGLARAAALAGNMEKARETYERFLTQWSGADPGLRFVEGARRDYARLK
jgi:tetratricopeptide (TPR) repeat protein